MSRPHRVLRSSSPWLRFAVRAAAGASLVAIAGCAVDQQKEVAIYRKELDRTSPKPAGYDGNRDLTLVDALSLANENNEQLGLSGEDYLQALIAKNRAVAGFLPTLTFQPSFTIEQTPRTNALQGATGSGTTNGNGTSTGTETGTGTSGGSGTGTSGTGTTGAAGGSAVNSSGSSIVSSGFRRFSNEAVYNIQAPVVGQLNLFRGGFDLASVRSADATIEQRRQLLLDAQATVLLNVAQTYYAVLRSERSVEVLGNTLKVQQARLKDVEQQFANGLATRLAVAQTRAQLDATRVTLVLADGDVKNGRSTLAFLIGSNQVAGKLTDDFKTPERVPGEDGYEREAVRSRQDLIAAHAAVEAARQNVHAAIAQYYPSVTLNVEGFLYREYYSDASKWSTLLSVNLPIFTAGIIEADVRQAWSRLRQALLNESYVRRQALTDVRRGYQNLETADERIAALRDEVEAANDAFKQSQGALTANLAINLDVLTAQDQLLSSQLDLAASQYDRTVFYLDLLRATGTLTVNQVIAVIASPAPATRPTTQGVINAGGGNGVSPDASPVGAGLP